MASISANGSNGHHKFTLNVTETGTNTNNNTSSISWSLVLSPIQTGWNWSYSSTVPVTYSVTINGTKYTGNIMNYNGSSTVTVRSGSMTVAHNSDGSKSISFSFSVSSISASYLPGSASASGSMSLTKIPRQATVTSAVDFTDETNPTISFTNPGGFNLQPYLNFWKNGTLVKTIYRDLGKYSSPYAWSLTDDEREEIRSLLSDVKSCTVNEGLDTYNGSTKLGYSSIGKTITIVNANPTVGSFTYQDSNSTTTAITEDNQRIIRNNSKLLFTVGTATALKNATISKYEITFNGVTKSITSAGDLDFGTVNVSSDTTATLTVTDSRGNTATKDITVVIDDWVLPTALINLGRKNNFYSETDIKVDATYSSLNEKNSITIKHKYKKVTDNDYSELYDLEDSVQSTFLLDNNYQWNVVIVVSDKIGQTTYNYFIDRGMPLIYFDRHNSSLGVNGFPSHKNSFEVFGDFYLNGVKQ